MKYDWYLVPQIIDEEVDRIFPYAFVFWDKNFYEFICDKNKTKHH